MTKSPINLARLGLFSIAFASIAATAAPTPIVTVTTNYNGFATVGGKLSEKPTGPVGVSVTNGNVKTSTITDPNGSWAVVFEIRSSSYSVESWNLLNAADHSAIESYPLFPQ